jgi:hypothetical protein
MTASKGNGNGRGSGRKKQRKKQNPCGMIARRVKPAASAEAGKRERKKQIPAG